MEPFGTWERNWTEQEKEKVIQFLKTDNHVPLKLAEMVFSAEVESAYFENAGKLLGGIAAVSFFFFPVIRQQNFTRRLFFSAIPGFAIYKWGKDTRDELRWGKSNFLTFSFRFRCLPKVLPVSWPTPASFHLKIIKKTIKNIFPIVFYKAKFYKINILYLQNEKYI